MRSSRVVLSVLDLTWMSVYGLSAESKHSSKESEN